MTLSPTSFVAIQPTMTIKFTLERETKGAVRYKEVDPTDGQALPEFIIGTLYVRKSGLRTMGFETIPKTMTVELNGE